MWERIKLSNSYAKALEQVSCTFYFHSYVSLTAAVDRQRTNALAELHGSQMQAEGNQNNTISYQDATFETATTVCSCHSTFTYLCPQKASFRPKLIGVKKKSDRREAVREMKALSAAHLERSIEKELIERLKSKAYGDAPLNVNEKVWQAIFDQERNRGDKDQDETNLELVDDLTDEEELEDEVEGEWGGREFVSDLSGDESDDSPSDLEDVVVRG